MLFCEPLAATVFPAPPEAEPRDMDHRSSKLAAGFCCCAPAPGDVVDARRGGDAGDMVPPEVEVGTSGAPIGGGEAIMGRIMFCMGAAGGA